MALFVERHPEEEGKALLLRYLAGGLPSVVGPGGRPTGGYRALLVASRVYCVVEGEDAGVVTEDHAALGLACGEVRPVPPLAGMVGRAWDEAAAAAAVRVHWERS